MLNCSIKGYRKPWPTAPPSWHHHHLLTRKPFYECMLMAFNEYNMVVPHCGNLLNWNRIERSLISKSYYVVPPSIANIMALLISLNCPHKPDANMTLFCITTTTTINSGIMYLAISPLPKWNVHFSLRIPHQHFPAPSHSLSGSLL